MYYPDCTGRWLFPRRFTAFLVKGKYIATLAFKEFQPREHTRCIRERLYLELQTDEAPIEVKEMILGQK
jgi:hypothetical protein